MGKVVPMKKKIKEKKINNIDQLIDFMNDRLDDIFEKSLTVDKDSNYIIYQIFWKTINEARQRGMCIHFVQDMFKDSLVDELEFEKYVIDEDIKELKAR